MPIDSLEEFLSAVRASCEEHAERKGYLKHYKSGETIMASDNVLGKLMHTFGIEADHAIGEILAKLLEFKRTPRRVLAEKAAGWAWRLWLTVEDNEYDRTAHAAKASSPAGLGGCTICSPAPCNHSERRYLPDSRHP